MHLPNSPEDAPRVRNNLVKFNQNRWNRFGDNRHVFCEGNTFEGPTFF
jgi:hypothetical protein